MRLKSGICFSVCVCCAVLLAWTQPASATQIPAYADVYDFDSLTPGWDGSNILHGQDNWTVTEAQTGSGHHHLYVNTSPRGGAPAPGSGYCLTEMGSTDTHSAYRANDANWSFDLSSQPQFAFGMSMSTDYGVSGYYGFGMVGLKNSVTGKMLKFGIQIQPWFYAVELYDASGTKYTGTQPRPTAINQKWYFKCEVDTTANGGEGSASVYTWRPGTHTEWQAMGNLQGINMQLSTASADILNADTLHASIDTRLVATDDIWVTSSSADLTVKKFFDCNLDDTKNGEDIYLSGWQFNVSNVAHGGSYNQSHTTDVNGEINLIGLTPGDYDITETVKGTGWVLSGANPRTETVSGTTVVGFGNQLPGDANQDEKVNLADFTILKAHFGEDPAGWTFGNFNADTTVNLADFTILKANFGLGAPSAGGVPEPATMGLLALGALVLLKRRRS